jgi:hypothetical protein
MLKNRHCMLNVELQEKPRAVIAITTVHLQEHPVPTRTVLEQPEPRTQQLLMLPQRLLLPQLPPALPNDRPKR